MRNTPNAAIAVATLLELGFADLLHGLAQIEEARDVASLAGKPNSAESLGRLIRAIQGALNSYNANEIKSFAAQLRGGAV